MIILHKQFFPISDEDECNTGSHDCTCGGLAGCTATCTNIPGGYTCACSAGFTLGTDRLTCVGKDTIVCINKPLLQISRTCSIFLLLVESPVTSYSPLMPWNCFIDFAFEH